MLRAGASEVHGTGVFATGHVDADVLLDRAPVLLVPAGDWEALGGTALEGYVFSWGDDGDTALALGIVTLVNHSYDPNCRYEHDHTAGEVLLWSLRPIAPGEEVTVNYNGDPDDDGPLWFDVSG